MSFTLALLPVIVATVIMAVNGNLGAGIAVAGSFSLIRFRSVQGTGKEILAIFLAAAVGLCLGAGYAAAACLLMPRFLVERVLKRQNDSRKVILYENGILSQDQKILIQKMADTLGVSYTAFFYRLSELNLFDKRPVEEYLHTGLHYGGEALAVSC